MPKDKVKTHRQGAEAWRHQHGAIFYEGYAAHGIALMVETATDNPTRTANVRNVFNKCGGNLGNSGSVALVFTQMGVFRLKPEDVDRDEMELEPVDFDSRTSLRRPMTMAIHCCISTVARLSSAPFNPSLRAKFGCVFGLRVGTKHDD